MLTIVELALTQFVDDAAIRGFNAPLPHPPGHNENQEPPNADLLVECRGGRYFIDVQMFHRAHIKTDDRVQAMTRLVDRARKKAKEKFATLPVDAQGIVVEACFPPPADFDFFSQFDFSKRFALGPGFDRQSVQFYLWVGTSSRPDTRPIDFELSSSPYDRAAALLEFQRRRTDPT